MRLELKELCLRHSLHVHIIAVCYQNKLQVLTCCCSAFVFFANPCCCWLATCKMIHNQVAWPDVRPIKTQLYTTIKWVRFDLELIYRKNTIKNNHQTFFLQRSTYSVSNYDSSVKTICKIIKIFKDKLSKLWNLEIPNLIGNKLETICCNFWPGNGCFTRRSWSKSSFLAFFHVFLSLSLTYGKRRKSDICIPCRSWSCSTTRSDK